MTKQCLNRTLRLDSLIGGMEEFVRKESKRWTLLHLLLNDVISKGQYASGVNNVIEIGVVFCELELRFHHRPGCHGQVV